MFLQERKSSVFPWIGEGLCSACRAGEENLCDKPRSVPKGLPSDSVANVILNAISSQKPKTKCIVGSRRLKLGVTMKKFVPDKIFFSQVAKRIHQN